MKFRESLKNAFSRQSLIWRALLFGAAWLFFPFWLFFVTALYLYFVPFFRPLGMILPFLSLIFFAWIGGGGILYALFLAIVFYLILGLKDLTFIEKKPVREVLILLIMFVAFDNLFYKFSDSGDAGAFFSIFILSIIFFLLVKNYLHSDDLPDVPSAGAEPKKRFRSVVAAIAAVMLLELSLAVIFLPLSFLYQTAIMFLSTTLLLELAGDYLGKTLTRRVILIDFSIFFAFLAVILGLAPWEL